jgi:hypothetical protein
LPTESSISISLQTQKAAGSETGLGEAAARMTSISCAARAQGAAVALVDKAAPRHNGARAVAQICRHLPWYAYAPSSFNIAPPAACRHDAQCHRRRLGQRRRARSQHPPPACRVLLLCVATQQHPAVCVPSTGTSNARCCPCDRQCMKARNLPPVRWGGLHQDGDCTPWPWHILKVYLPFADAYRFVTG